MTLLLKQILSETNIFLSTTVIWEREKRGFTSYLSAWGSDRRVCLKILPSWKNEIYLWKMARKCTRRLTKVLPWPVGRDRKILTGLRTNQIAGFVTVPSEKKISYLTGYGVYKGRKSQETKRKKRKKLKNR